MMQVRIFGQLTDITTSTIIEIEDCATIADFKSKLYSIYPLLKERKFNVAIGTKLSDSDDTQLHGEVLSLLPPYSGG